MENDNLLLHSISRSLLSLHLFLVLKTRYTALQDTRRSCGHLQDQWFDDGDGTLPLYREHEEAYLTRPSLGVRGISTGSFIAADAL